MSAKGFKRLALAVACVSSMILLSVPAFAAIPETGDGAGSIIPIMAGLLGVSVILVIVYFVLSKKKK